MGFDGKDIAELLYLVLSESTEATDGIIVFVHGEEREARCIQPHHATAGFHSVATAIPAKIFPIQELVQAVAHSRHRGSRIPIRSSFLLVKL